MVCLSHAEYVARCASRRVPDHDETAGQQAIANDAALAVVPARILDLDRSALENNGRVFKVQPSIGQCARTFDRVEGNAH